MTEWHITCMMTPYRGAARHRCWAGSVIGSRADADQHCAALAAAAASRTYPDWQQPSTEYQVSAAPAPPPPAPLAETYNLDPLGRILASSGGRW